MPEGSVSLLQNLRKIKIGMRVMRFVFMKEKMQSIIISV